MELIIEASGHCRCIYDETVDLTVLGSLSVRRASHVEPDDQGRWIADLSPVDGPRLGPFTHRSAALEAEIAWLQHLGSIQQRAETNRLKKFSSSLL